MFGRYRGHGRHYVHRILQLRHGSVRILRTLRVRVLGDKQVFCHAVFRPAVRQRYTVPVTVSVHVCSLQGE